MSVEELIAELQKMPSHYTVKAFYEGVELPDLELDITFVECQSMFKQVDMVIDKMPPCLNCAGADRAIGMLSEAVGLPQENTDCRAIAQKIEALKFQKADMSFMDEALNSGDGTYKP